MLDLQKPLKKKPVETNPDWKCGQGWKAASQRIDACILVQLPYLDLHFLLVLALVPLLNLLDLGLQSLHSHRRLDLEISQHIAKLQAGYHTLKVSSVDCFLPPHLPCFGFETCLHLMQLRLDKAAVRPTEA